MTQPTNQPNEAKTTALTEVIIIPINKGFSVSQSPLRISILSR